jgi:hypothetical protein
MCDDAFYERDRDRTRRDPLRLRFSICSTVSSLNCDLLAALSEIRISLPIQREHA